MDTLNSKNDKIQLLLDGNLPSPCFVMDVIHLKNNLSFIKKIETKTGATFLVSLKAFSTWKLFPYLQEFFNTFSVSSLNEARLGFEKTSCKVHTFSPAYLPGEFDAMMEYSSHLTFNSFNQFERFSNKLSHEISYGIRINPEYSDVKTALYNPCIQGSRLGVTISNMPESLPNAIKGLHIHNLCESNSDSLEKTLEIVVKKFHKYLCEVEWINLGGGHLLTSPEYKLELFYSNIHKFMNTFPNLEIFFEPGTAYFFNTGYLVSEILDIVENDTIKTAILNVSFAAHMPDILEMPYKPNILGATYPQAGKPVYRMGGVTCLAGDFVGEYTFEKPLKTGDKIVFCDMMHYTMVKTNMFNGVKHPSIGMINEKNEFVLLRQFSYNDYVGRLS